MKRIFERHSDSVEQLQEEVLATLDNFHDPFSLMPTTYMQDSTIQKLFNTVKPEETVLRLRCLIEQHLKVFKQLFPENNIIPKQHYLLHLPAQILSQGPMWSSKLNFKNVCKSLVKHNQLFECRQNEIGMEHPIFCMRKN
ncbi:hypothetical protein PAMP_013748 [Pampus punctatissimus]